jgi:hypothetical protein
MMPATSPKCWWTHGATNAVSSSMRLSRSVRMSGTAATKLSRSPSRWLWSGSRSSTALRARCRVLLTEATLVSSVYQGGRHLAPA